MMRFSLLLLLSLLALQVSLRKCDFDCDCEVPNIPTFAYPGISSCCGVRECQKGNNPIVQDNICMLTLESGTTNKTANGKKCSYNCPTTYIGCVHYNECRDRQRDYCCAILQNPQTTEIIGPQCVHAGLNAALFEGTLYDSACLNPLDHRQPKTLCKTNADCSGTTCCADVTIYDSTMSNQVSM